MCEGSHGSREIEGASEEGGWSFEFWVLSFEL